MNNVDTYVFILLVESHSLSGSMQDNICMRCPFIPLTMCLLLTVGNSSALKLYVAIMQLPKFYFGWRWWKGFCYCFTSSTTNEGRLQKVKTGLAWLRGLSLPAATVEVAPTHRPSTIFWYLTYYLPWQFRAVGRNGNYTACELKLSALALFARVFRLLCIKLLYHNFQLLAPFDCCRILYPKNVLESNICESFLSSELAVRISH